jgi:uncharacterized protein (TIGR02757 family)
MPLRKHHASLDDVYRRYNRRGFIRPDPLQFVLDYDDDHDRAIVALVASCLAYGRVAHILRSVSRVLALLGPGPAEFVKTSEVDELRKLLGDFRHRFAAGCEVADLLGAAGAMLRRHGSLEAAFCRELDDGDRTVVPALGRFVDALQAAGAPRTHLLPTPAGGSACKRLHLLLRWMARRDDVDPGPWRSVPTEKLVIPLDTHMHRIARSLGATQRNSADLVTALEVTEAFRRIRPDDPVRYDFALTRLGIRTDAKAPELRLQ